MKQSKPMPRTAILGLRLLAKRFLSGMAMLLALSFACFVLLDWAPGDFLTDAVLNPQLSEATTQELRIRFGLEKSLGMRYFMWLKGLFRGELGPSFAYRVDAATLLFPRLSATLGLNLFALAITLILAAPAAILAASYPTHILAKFSNHAIQSALAFPEIVVVLVLMAAAIRWEIPLPGGLAIHVPGGDPAAGTPAWQAILVPSAALIFGAVPVFYRHIRAAVAEAINLPFVAAARQSGIARRAIYGRYIFPAAANPLISLAGVTLGGLLSASLVVETVTGWPGLGPLMLEAVLARDSFVVTGAVLLSAAALLAGNLVADLLLLWLDPRIRR